MKFKPTWLYVKKCDHCELVYFGKTVHDLDHYKGSGTYWLLHLRKHKCTSTTIWKKRFEDQGLLIMYALFFSFAHDIVASPRWANLQHENGIGAGINHSERVKQLIREARARQALRGVSDETRAKLSAAGYRQKRIYGRKHSEETRLKISLNSGSRSEKHRRRMSEVHSGRVFSQNSIDKMVASAAQRPIVKCPHCDATGKNPAMGKWHFNNCRAA